jgi:uncharacterized protein YfkK (UPF0435 family)
MIDVNKLHETLNARANKILEIERHFKSVKVPIDLSYLDAVDDKMLEGIYDMVKRAEK